MRQVIIILVLALTLSYLVIGSFYFASKNPDSTLGVALTTINGSDRITDSRAVINTNFSNLNTSIGEARSEAGINITTVGGTSYLMASSTSLAWRFPSGFVSAASSTVSSTLHVSGNLRLGLGSGFTYIDSSGLVQLGTAGRSLTFTTGTLDADAELFTSMVSFNVSTSSMSTTTSVSQHKFATAVTISRISCSTDQGTSTIQFEERTEGTENTAGTDVLTSALSCGSGSDTNASTAFSNATIAADAPFNFEITDAAPNGTKPSRLRVHVDFTRDD